MASTTSKPTRQSPNTCCACRARKVRCDGRRDVCTSCERLSLVCSFQNPQATGMPVRRRRAHVACLACHSRKIRCNEDRPSCRRCVRLKMDCVYPTHRSMSPSSRGDTPILDTGQLRIGTLDPNQRSSGPTSGDDLQDMQGAANSILSDTTGSLVPGRQNRPNDPADDAVWSAFNLFFTRVRNTPVFSFLHQASIMEQYRNGVLDRALMLSLVGIVSMVTDVGPGMRERGTEYIAEAEQLILGDMEKPTLAKVQALIFIIKHRAFSKRFSSVFILTAMAIRFAMGLRLNYEDTELSFLARESCRRTMWSLYLIDSVLSAGYPEFSLSTSALLHIQLPSHDFSFDMDIPQEVCFLEPAEAGPSEVDISPLALTIRIMRLRQRILQFTKQAVTGQYDRSNLRSDIEEWRSKLENFSDRLPRQLKLTTHNTKLHVHSPNLSNFITMHITWHGTQSILHRLVLDGLIEALPSHIITELDPDYVVACQQRCFETAKSMAQFLGVLLTLKPGNVPLDLDIAVSVYQCLRMLIYSYRALITVVFDTAEDVIEHCQVCAKFLDTMFCNCEAVDDIKRDASKLIETSLSPLEDTPGGDNEGSPSTLKDTQGRHHILSKHSLVGQIEMPDKQDSFLMSPVPSETQQGNSQTPDRPSHISPESTILRHFSPSLHMGDVPLHSLSDLSLPDFELDSSIMLPNSWLEYMPVDQEGYL